MKSIVCIGGGGGTSHVLKGTRSFFDNQTAVIGVTDTGRSTGIARELGNMPAPGDFRNVLAHNAATPDSTLARLLNFRLKSNQIPQLDGMAFGNILIATLQQMTGNFSETIQLVKELIPADPEIIPVSFENTHICAELEDGSFRETEFNVRELNKAKIKRLFLKDPGARASSEAINAILSADLVTLGPGSFFTTVLSCLVFPGMREALSQTRAKVVFICNSTTQPGQTDGFTVLDHISHLQNMIGSNTIDAVLVNRTHQLDSVTLAHYAEQGLHLLDPDDQEIQKIETMTPTVIVKDFVKHEQEKLQNWNKLDTIKYDEALIGETLHKLATE